MPIIKFATVLHYCCNNVVNIRNAQCISSLSFWVRMSPSEICIFLVINNFSTFIMSYKPIKYDFPNWNHDLPRSSFYWHSFLSAPFSVSGQLCIMPVDQWTIPCTGFYVLLSSVALATLHHQIPSLTQCPHI